MIRINRGRGGDKERRPKFVLLKKGRRIYTTGVGAPEESKTLSKVEEWVDFQK